MNADDQKALTPREVSLYVHVPFCQSKCHYCGFYSLCASSGSHERYLEALAVETRLVHEEILSKADDLAVPTIYIGGGTPSQLGAQQIRRLLDVVTGRFPPAPDCEVSVEVNPEDVDRDLLMALRSAGVTRLSMGAQSFLDSELEFLGRRTDSLGVRRALGEIREFGWENLNLDLIFGLPDQSPDQWLFSVEEALRFQPAHLSCYLLTLEVNTVLEELLHGGFVEAALEETVLAQYQAAREVITGAGFEHYEISNFARDGLRCRHNEATWQRKPYLGLGPAAHSFDGETRWRNSASLDDYSGTLLEDGRRPVQERVRLAEGDNAKEMIYLGLRLAEGLRWDAMAAVLDDKALDRLKRRVRFLSSTGFLETDAAYFRLAPEAYFVSNSVFVELIRSLEEDSP